MTYDEVVSIALELPDVAEARMYGKPAVKRANRYMFSVGREPATIAVKLDWDTHDDLLAQRPALYFKTSHYDGWPGLLARLDLLDEASARDLVRASWEDAPNKAKAMKPGL